VVPFFLLGCVERPIQDKGNGTARHIIVKSVKERFGYVPGLSEKKDVKHITHHARDCGLLDSENKFFHFRIQ